MCEIFKNWQRHGNVPLIRDPFTIEDANAILAIHVPQSEVPDRVAWMGSNNGVYSAKSGFHHWFNMQFGNSVVPQSIGWRKVWHLKHLNKIKVFIWRFCHNVIPIRRRLRSRGVRIPIICPICSTDIEHMAHLFFDCEFATGCWSHVNFYYDWMTVESAADLLLEQL
ncbi:uncharacterized protein LOC141673555 [Apium graveolens]|uniref:uncharacterized protein LOC141673551 n=1 Tax=Apium graveolens TaxID=4045 RepID=UPI003D7B6884